MMGINKNILLIIFVLVSAGLSQAQSDVQLALLKYQGGGDWYANPTSLRNLAQHCNQLLDMDLKSDYATVEVGSADLFNYPFIHMTGHGNVVFSTSDAENLRTYLLGGGFLHIDDNYGMDPFVRPAMKSVFPELEFIELPDDHLIYKQFSTFTSGLPKIHKHDENPPQAFGLFWEGRLICLYTYECDLGDGWEDATVHNDPPEIRKAALDMGANIIQFVFGEIE